MYQTAPKSQADLKFHNLKLVFDLVKQEGPISRASLAKRTGLSPTSMTRIVNVLKRIGLISEHSVARAGRARCLKYAPMRRIAYALTLCRT